MNEWLCDRGHMFPIEEMEVEQVQVGARFKCPVCATQNIEPV